MVITNRKIPSQPIIEKTTPMSRYVHVTIAIFFIIVERKTVTAIITIDVQLVPVIERMRESGTYIIETSLTILITALFRQHAQEPVAISGTSAQHQRSTLLPQRDFQIQFTGKQSNTGHSNKLLLIGFLARNVQYRGDTSSILARNTALVNLHIIHHVTTERREEAEHVRRIVNGSSIQKHQVLVGSTTTYIEPGGCLAHGLHARQSLYHLQHIHFSHCHRNILQFRRFYFLHTQYRTFDRLHTSTCHQHFFHHQVLFFQFDTYIRIGIKHQVTTGILHRYSLQFQHLITRLQIDTEISIFIRYSHRPWFPANDMYTHSRCIGLEIDNLSSQLDFIFLGRLKLITNFIYFILRSQYFRKLDFLLHFRLTFPSGRQTGFQEKVLYHKDLLAIYIHPPESSGQSILQKLQRYLPFLFLDHERLRYIGIYLIGCRLFYLLYQTDDADAIRNALRCLGNNFRTDAPCQASQHQSYPSFSYSIFHNSIILPIVTTIRLHASPVESKKIGGVP